MGFNDMMSGWGSGAVGWTMFLGMIVFWVGIAVLVFWGMKSLIRTSAAPLASPSSIDPAVDVLKRRYAAGEIDSSEFEQKRRDLS